MLLDEDVQSFFSSIEFDKMLLKVGNDDMIGYKNNNQWIPEHPSTALIFAKANETWRQLSTEYHSNFKDLVTGELPSEAGMINTLLLVSERLKKVDWLIIGSIGS